ncbi:MAG: extracellular matrix regulator RemB [Bacillota bacterium]
MFLHVGTDVVVSLKRVIAILDLKSAGSTEATREFIEQLRSKKKVTDISAGEAKSLVLTESEAFLSPISSLTLKKRCDFLTNNPNLDFVL